MNQRICIYTDGSCHSQSKTGAWAAIIMVNNDKIILHSIVTGTTHNRMELMAVIKAVEYVKAYQTNYHQTDIYSDSQYVVHLAERKEKLKRNHFTTKKGTPIQNADLVQILIRQLDRENLRFIKVNAHQKKEETTNHNREVDIFVRKMLRTYVNQHLLH